MLEEKGWQMKGPLNKNDKKKKWRILVVVVKQRHHANRLLIPIFLFPYFFFHDVVAIISVYQRFTNWFIANLLVCFTAYGIGFSLNGLNTFHSCSIRRSILSRHQETGNPATRLHCQCYISRGTIRRNKLQISFLLYLRHLLRWGVRWDSWWI